MSEVLVVGSPANRTNVALVERWRALGLLTTLIVASDADRLVQEGDVVIGRLDVLPTLDGVERGLLVLLRLERRGIRVLNRASALLTVHDKLLTARRLSAAGLPHPTTAAWSGNGAPPLQPPLVLKPRFGSWGRDVFLCANHQALARTLAVVRRRRWFRRHGAVLQELVQPCGFDLRVLIAAGEIVGASERVAAPGEWRTNVALGGTLRAATALPEASALAVAAAASVGADLVGVDLLPCDDGYTVLELNGAVDFDERYSLGGGDMYLKVADSLGLPFARRAPSRPRPQIKGGARRRS